MLCRIACLLALSLALTSCEVVESKPGAVSGMRPAVTGGTPGTSNAADGSGVLNAERMSPRLVYRGFSVGRPTEKEWYLRIQEQTPQRAVFRRKVKSPTRIVHFAAGLNLLDRAPASPEDFARLAKPNLAADTALQKPVYKPKLITWAGQPAIEYELTATLPARDGKARALRDKGLIVLHPGSPVTTLQIVFSQRGVEGELDEKLDAEGVALMQNVEITGRLE